MILSEKQLFCIHFLYNQPHLTAKRASSCISAYPAKVRRSQKGSITIETAMILPFFFLAIICLLYMMEVMTIRTSIRNGMQYAAKQVAEEACLKPAVTPAKLEEKIVEAIGYERLDRSIIVNGSGGINCDDSRMSLITGILEMHVMYKVRLPVPAISSATVTMEDAIKVKGWCGYTRAGWGEKTDETVYITENGMVYHMDPSCNYLELSIQNVSAASLDTLRNKDQSIYHACDSCAKSGAKETVYVTDYGDRYHNSLNCSGLKRTVYAIPRSEAIGKGVCKKCGR